MLCLIRTSLHHSLALLSSHLNILLSLHLLDILDFLCSLLPLPHFDSYQNLTSISSFCNWVLSSAMRTASRRLLPKPSTLLLPLSKVPGTTAASAVLLRRASQQGRPLQRRQQTATWRPPRRVRPRLPPPRLRSGPPNSTSKAIATSTAAAEASMGASRRQLREPAAWA